MPAGSTTGGAPGMSTTSSGNGGGRGGGRSNAGAIAGGIVGGVAGLVIITLLCCYLGGCWAQGPLAAYPVGGSVYAGQGLTYTTGSTQYLTQGGQGLAYSTSDTGFSGYPGFRHYPSYMDQSYVSASNNGRGRGYTTGFYNY